MSGPGVTALAMLFAAGTAVAQASVVPAEESADPGVAPTAELRLSAHSAPTPREIPGARTIRTEELQAMLARPPAEQPLLFDVLGGGGHASIPGAIWLADAGRGTSFEDALQEQLARTLEFIARGESTRLMIFFCANTSCWLSYNAALRAARLGYAVGWYRGGIDAWAAAGGKLAPMRVGWKRPQLR